MSAGTRPYLPALTLRQPWGWAIWDASKRIENRTWRMRYRGSLLLHAGARSRWDVWGERDRRVRLAWMTRATRRPEDERALTALCRRSPWMTFSAIAAIAEVIGCHHWDECEGTCSAWAAEGCWHIELAPEVLRLAAPVGCDGQRMLWQPDPAVTAAAVRQAAEGAVLPMWAPAPAGRAA